MRVIAPGKVMVAGEYAVLSGSPALVMAVNRYATASVTSTSPRTGIKNSAMDAHLEARATLSCALREGLIVQEYPVQIETSGLAQDGCKLGLGSSAAGCVAALGAVLTAEGHTIDSLRPAIARVARTGHREAQGGGSGVDVLASALGGTLCVHFPHGAEGEPVVTQVRWPENLIWSVFWTKTSARTSTLIRSVQAFGAENPSGMARCINVIRTATEALIEALDKDLGDQAIATVCAHSRAMDQLGQVANVPIITDAMRHFASAIEPLGAALKPSGAGGGDIVIAIMQNPKLLTPVRRLAQDLGFVPLDLHMDLQGVRVAPGELGGR